MEVRVKRKFYGLLLATFIICTSGSLTVSAKTAPKISDTTVVETPVQSDDNIAVHKDEEPTETTTTVVKKTVSKTVKVNKTFYSHKVLGIKKSKLTKYYNAVSDNTKIATVSTNGKVKGIKKGSTTITLTSKKTGNIYATINVTVKNRYTKKQLRLMSSLIYAEAGAECYAGKKAVGIVVMNRIRSKQFPNTLKGVIYDPGQFGPASNGYLKKSLRLYDQGKMNKKCIKAAKATLNGDTLVTYKKITTDMSSYLFFSGYVSGKRLQIQGHQFK